MDQAWRSSEVPGNLMPRAEGGGRSLSEDTENLRPRGMLSISHWLLICIFPEVSSVIHLRYIKWLLVPCHLVNVFGLKKIVGNLFCPV